MIYYKFKHRSVRDLAWCLLSKELFNTVPGPKLTLDDTPKLVAWLEQVDKAPDKLLSALLNNKSPRLGFYFEHLLRYFFEHYPRYELIYHNLQIFDNKQTIGECDFIIEDKQTHTMYHVETAVKFFIHRPYCLSFDKPKLAQATFEQWNEWVGPNDKDSLNLKLTQLINKQLLLSSTPQARAFFNTKSIVAPKPKLWLKGCLLKSFNSTQPSLKTQAYWLTPHEWLNRQNNNNYFVVLPKKFWLSPLIHDDHKSLTVFNTRQGLIDAINNKKPHMVASLDKEYQERERCLIIFK